MTPQMIALLALPCLVLATFSFVMWRRAGERAILFDEAARRLDQLKARLKETEERLEKANEKNSVLRDQMSRVDKAIEDARAKTTALIKQTESRENEWQTSRDKQARLTEHLTKQVDVLTAQLTESDQLRKDAEMHRDALHREGDSKAASTRDDLQTKLKEAHARISELAQKLSRADDRAEEFKKRLSDVDPAELKLARQKVQHYARMYASMKSLREMAEERNINWEVALRHLASWVVAHTDTRPPLPENASLGQTVGEALERIGARLIPEHEDHEPVHHDEHDHGPDHTGEHGHHA